MKLFTKNFLFIFLIIINSACTILDSKEENEKSQALINQAKAAKILVVDIHSDHCGPCKVIRPLIEELKVYYALNPNVAFLVYDLTNPIKARRTRNIGYALGLKDIYKSQRFTGVVLIIDNNDKKVLDTLVVEENKSKYIESIEKHLQNI